MLSFQHLSHGIKLQLQKFKIRPSSIALASMILILIHKIISEYMNNYQLLSLRISSFPSFSYFSFANLAFRLSRIFSSTNTRNSDPVFVGMLCPILVFFVIYSFIFYFSFSFFFIFFWSSSI